MTVHKLPVSSRSTCAAPASASRSDVSDRSTVLPFPLRETRRTVDVQRWFPGAFMRYLHATYDRPEDVTAVYGCRMSTAWMWWTAASAPSGHQVARTHLIDPGFTAFLAADFEAACLERAA